MDIQCKCMCFVDLEKVFDGVPQSVLWKVFQEYGVSYEPQLLQELGPPSRQ